ncbi:DUF262 domain-containing protein [Agrococcus lahaulensis]|nr:DUF262 domain-containing protein [Agrococcus lahaulensis]
MGARTGTAAMTGRPRFVTIRELFDGSRRFRVPIYQRAYAWGRLEIETLVRDIVSVLDRPNYYIGSLVLHEVRDIESDQPLFDVIDGQQRLTTLFVALTHPELRPALTKLPAPFEISDRLLSFEQRKRSNLDLAVLARSDTRSAAMKALQDDGIKAGAEALGNLLSDGTRLVRMLADQGAAPSYDAESDMASNVLGYLLDRVRLVLTELPPETDLNHYFEVMNTRGEQLEKHEIVKAHLLGLIGEDSEGRALFSTVWDACSDFTRHVQARFEPNPRSAIFGHPGTSSGSGWDRFEPTDVEDLASRVQPAQQALAAGGRFLDSVLEEREQQVGVNSRGVQDDGDAGRYGAIIDFPNFLLHVLRMHVDGQVEIPLDDKKLVALFERAITTADSALAFAFRLLRAKFLFDNFVIKPLDEPGPGADSNWVVHRLRRIQPETRSAKLSASNAFGEATQQVLMLQAMYQVTHQRRVYKEFLYRILEYLDRSWAKKNHVDGADFILRLHRMAEDDLEELGAREGSTLDVGTGVPHFALNLLDYKLWWSSVILDETPEGLPSVNAAGFRFAYRTSIEHFLPVNLAESAEQRVSVNDFGNLCLMTRTENSIRSDHTPDWKVAKYGTSDQSLKFHYMAELQKQDGKWGATQINEQGRAMRSVLFKPLPL